MNKSIRKIILFKNIDKKDGEKWTAGRGMGNIPHPFRMIVVGQPSSGKTLFCKNIIAQQKPFFERICLLHPDEDTQEYAPIDCDVLPEIPHHDEFDPEVKNLLIIDDVELRNALKNKEEKAKLNKLLSYGSTHRNLSIIITSQDIFSQTTASISRFSNIVNIFRFTDRQYLLLLCSKFGLDKKKFIPLIKSMPSPHDSIMIDRTEGTPYPVRYNIFQHLAEYSC